MPLRLKAEWDVTFRSEAIRLISKRESRLLGNYIYYQFLNSFIYLFSGWNYNSNSLRVRNVNGCVNKRRIVAESMYCWRGSCVTYAKSYSLRICKSRGRFLARLRRIVATDDFEKRKSGRKGAPEKISITSSMKSSTLRGTLLPHWSTPFAMYTGTPSLSLSVPAGIWHFDELARGNGRSFSFHARVFSLTVYPHGVCPFATDVYLSLGLTHFGSRSNLRSHCLQNNRH